MVVEEVPTDPLEVVVEVLDVLVQGPVPWVVVVTSAGLLEVVPGAGEKVGVLSQVCHSVMGQTVIVFVWVTTTHTSASGSGDAETVAEKSDRAAAGKYLSDRMITVGTVKPESGKEWMKASAF